jgi:hypothetical protein
MIAIRFKPVSDIPNGLKNRKRKDVRGMLESFINEDIKYAQVILDDEDYCRPDTAMQAIRSVAERYDYPIVPKTRRGSIYITRTDMEE